MLYVLKIHARVVEKQEVMSLRALMKSKATKCRFECHTVHLCSLSTLPSVSTVHLINISYLLQAGHTARTIRTSSENKGRIWLGVDDGQVIFPSEGSLPHTIGMRTDCMSGSRLFTSSFVHDQDFPSSKRCLHLILVLLSHIGVSALFAFNITC